MSGDAPERMYIEMSEHMSDKNVKRYVRGSVNRNVRNMSDKTVKTYVRRKCNVLVRYVLRWILTLFPKIHFGSRTCICLGALHLFFMAWHLAVVFVASAFST